MEIYLTFIQCSELSNMRTPSASIIFKKSTQNMSVECPVAPCWCLAPSSVDTFEPKPLAQQELGRQQHATDSQIHLGVVRMDYYKLACERKQLNSLIKDLFWLKYRSRHFDKLAFHEGQIWNQYEDTLFDLCKTLYFINIGIFWN